jgi:hypothetical protein
MTEKAADFGSRTPTTPSRSAGGNRSGLRVSSTITFARVSSSENPTHYRQAPEKSMKFVRCFCKRVLATAIASGVGRRIEQAKSCGMAIASITAVDYSIVKTRLGVPSWQQTR